MIFSKENLYLYDMYSIILVIGKYKNLINNLVHNNTYHPMELNALGF